MSSLGRFRVGQKALRFLQAILMLAVVPLFAACGSSSSKPAAVADSSGPASIAIVETDSGFEPESITVKHGQMVNVKFSNKGKVIHNLRVAGGEQFATAADFVLGNPVVQPGESASGAWQAPPEAGKRRFRCDVHPNHTGTITIQ